MEISEEIIGAVRFFDDAGVPRLLGDERSRIIWEDARVYLTGADKKYDVILSDVLLSSTTGTTTLLSQEFFELCRARPNEGGIMAIATSISSNKLTRSITATFRTAFPYVVAYQHGNLRTFHSRYLLGSTSPIEPDIQRVADRFPTGYRAFRLVGVRNAEHAMRNQVPDGLLDAITEGVPVLTDNLPYVDFMLTHLDGDWTRPLGVHDAQRESGQRSSASTSPLRVWPGILSTQPGLCRDWDSAPIRPMGPWARHR